MSCVEFEGGCSDHLNNLHVAVTWRPDGHVHETFFFFLYCSVGLTAHFLITLYIRTVLLTGRVHCFCCWVSHCTALTVLLLSDIDVVHFAMLSLAMEHILCIFLLTSVVSLTMSSHFTLNGCQASHGHTMKQVMVVYQLDQRQCSEHKQTNQQPTP